MPATTPDELLALALSRPHDAIATARIILAARPPAYQASVARQATGLGLRQIGELGPAIRELRAALRLARASGRPERVVDVLASLGASLGRAGRAREALAAFDEAVRDSRGVRDNRGALAGRVLLRRADTLLILGRYEEALADAGAAVTRLRRAGDLVWAGRSLGYRGFIQLALGATRRADEDFAVAARLFAETGQEFEYAQAMNNRGLAAYARGDLPAALAYLDEAAHLFAALHTTDPNLAIDRCGILLAAGLAAEALHEADAGAARMERDGGHATKRAELFFAGARAALAAGDPAAARQRADRARRLFLAQDRQHWAARAGLVAAEARYATGDHSARLLRRAADLARRLDRSGAPEALPAHLLAGRIALAGRHPAAAATHLARVARTRHHGPPLSRSAAWLARALLCDARGETRAAIAACGRGLDALDEHRLMLGATELRAHATAHGAELAALAQRDALRRDDARRLLVWSERWRATALDAPPVRPAADLVAELAALREVARRIEAAQPNGPAGGRSATAVLERERRRLEEAVRARTLRVTASAGATAARRPLDALPDALGAHRLVELVEVDGTLHAVVVAGGRFRRFEVGPVADAEREVEMARFRLRRLAHARLPAAGGPPLSRIGQRLEATLLGPAAAALGDAPVVVVPPGRLHAVPWGLLPTLADRPVSVAPSAATWLRARDLAPPAGHRVALVYGPGLGTGGAEVPHLAEQYPAATVLGGGSATAEQVLAALDGAWLAHVAAHGTFRSDSPLFSALRLDDGPLTVHDLGRLDRAPYRLILSSCESGIAKPVGADELLGLTTGLVPLGAAGILASVVPVNDAAAVPLMLALHTGLRAGDSLPEALARARSQTGDDPVAVATGRSFVALGV